MGLAECLVQTHVGGPECGTHKYSLGRPLVQGVGVGVWVCGTLRSGPPIQPALEAVSPARHPSPTSGAAGTSLAHSSVHRSFCPSIRTGTHHGPSEHAHLVLLLQDVRHPG